MIIGGKRTLRWCFIKQENKNKLLKSLVDGVLINSTHEKDHSPSLVTFLKSTSYGRAKNNDQILLELDSFTSKIWMSNVKLMYGVLGPQ